MPRTLARSSWDGNALQMICKPTLGEQTVNPVVLSTVWVRPTPYTLAKTKHLQDLEICDFQGFIARRVVQTSAADDPQIGFLVVYRIQRNSGCGLGSP